MIKDIVVIGHRGACGYYPENTLLSFKKAFEMGVDYIELDVRLSKDGFPVVMHDETLDRTTDGSGRVREYTLEELKRFDAGSGERIPTLEEVIELVVKMDGKLLIEIKDVDAVDDVIRLVEKHNLIKRSKIVSFHLDALLKVPDYMDKGLIYAWPGRWIEKALEIKATAILPKYTLVSEKMVGYAHYKGLGVYVWNIDDVENAERMFQFKVDGIASNKPDIIIDFLRSR